MVRFVAVTQALEDFDCVLRARLIDLDRLEAALERCVLFDVLAVFIQRGCADDLHFAAGQGGLQNVRSVCRSLSSARAHQHMHLIDEQDGVLVSGQLFDDLLDAFLEFAAVLGARDHAGQVKRHDALVLQRLRYITRDDLLRQSFDYGGLADAGVADQRGVVLGAARQNLNDPLDFLAAADDRVELALAGSGGQIAAELLERVTRLAGCTGSAGAFTRLTAAQHLAELFGHHLRGDLEVRQRSQRHILSFVQQAE